jgi:hypothetical protein
MPILASLFTSLFGDKLKPKNESNVKPISTAPTPVSAAPAAPATSAAPKTTAYTPLAPREEYPSVFSARSLKQLGLFFGGAGFLCFSILLTRRAINRQRIKSRLRFYQTNDWKGLIEGDVKKRGDPLVALEALNLATLNTLSVFIMAAGGMSWAFNISSVADMKEITQRSIMATSNGVTDEESEQEVVDWMAKTLGMDVEQTSASETGNPASDEASKSVSETSRPASETSKPASDEASKS